MDLEDAARQHGAWKLTFRGAISRQENLDAATIGRDDCCDVGRWLHGEGKRRWGTKPEFQRAFDRHREFHAEAGKVATLINAGKFDQAQAALDSGSPYARVSSDVGVALIALKKVAAG